MLMAYGAVVYLCVFMCMFMRVFMCLVCVRVTSATAKSGGQARPHDAGREGGREGGREVYLQSRLLKPTWHRHSYNSHGRAGRMQFVLRLLPGK